MDRIMYKLEVGQRWVHIDVDKNYAIYEIVDIDDNEVIHDICIESNQEHRKPSDLVYSQFNVDNYFTEADMQHISILSPLWKVLNG